MKRREFLGMVIGTVVASGVPFVARPARAGPLGPSVDGFQPVAGHSVVGFDGWSIAIFTSEAADDPGIQLPTPLRVMATPYGYTVRAPTLIYTRWEAMTYIRAQMYDARGDVVMSQSFQPFTAVNGDYIDVAMNRIHEGKDD